MPRRELMIPAAVITVVCLFGVSAGASPSVWAKQGGSVLLKCSVSPPVEGSSAPPHVVEWVRQGYDIPVLIKFGAYAPRLHPNYEGRASLSGGTSLRLDGLVLEDGGWYECRILLLDKPSDETRNGSWTLLSVSAPPTFTEAPPTATEAYLGRPMTLKCVARGNPPPTVTWYKDGTVVKETDKVKVVNGSVFLVSVSRGVAGAYQCRASNREGNVTSSTKLRVKGPPVIVIPPTDTVLNVSQNALLRCQAEADPTNMTYVWTREGENVYHIESMKSRVKVMVDGTLLISHLIPVDSGNYTCMPTNGLPAPPTASALLTVQHPAQVVQMPPQLYLPMGLSGQISCPVLSQPALLRVSWMKDGRELDLNMYPGWMLTAEGSIVIATATEDAAGVYTCTPYNSYGTAGRSKPTTVILQDPPSLRVSPHEEYRQEVGRKLQIPCQADGDPAPDVTWSKPGSSSPPLYSVADNGTLLLDPLSKEHYGVWECSVTNRVASVTATTTVLVLGTSPHAASSVTVEVGVNQANVSWEPGFDGGYTQTFTIWLRCVCAGEFGQQDWRSVSTSSSSNVLLTGLLSSTHYQFSVLAHNKLGSGPFSDIASATTLGALPVTSVLEPPDLLSVNQTSEGVYLQWEGPSLQEPPLTAFVLQSRVEGGEWLNLDEDIGVNKSVMLVQGLLKNCNYELRLLSRRGDQLSAPSRSVNVSTLGMITYPTSSRLLEFVPQPLLAGVMGGMGFLCLALLLALATVCAIGHRRNRRRRKMMMMMEDLPPAACKNPSLKAGSAHGSPDSILKQKLLPPRPLSASSSSSSSNHSSIGNSGRSEYHGQRHHLLPRSHPPSSHPSVPESTLSPSSPVELIHRGPDGRFALDPYEVVTTTPLRHPKLNPDLPQTSEPFANATVRKTQSLHSSTGERRVAPFVLSVDVPPSCGSDIFPPGRVRPMARHLSLRGCYTLPKENEIPEFPEKAGDQSSLSSSESGASVQYSCSENRLSLKRGSTRSTASTLVLQMEHEREQGNLSRCLRLAHEREELERELQQYTFDRGTNVGFIQRSGSLRVQQQKEKESGWESVAPLHRPQTPSRGHRLSNNAFNRGTRRPSSCIPWESSSVMSSSSLAPAQPGLEGAGEYLQDSHSSHLQNYRRSRSLERGAHQKSRNERGDERADYGPEDGVSNSGSYGHNQRYIVCGVSQSADTQPKESRCMEMSVDGPEIQTQTLYPGYDAQNYHRPSLYQLEREDQTKSSSRTLRRGSARNDRERSDSRSSRTLPSLDGLYLTLPKGFSVHSQHLNRHTSAPSLDYKKGTGEFLAPDAWIDLLSRGQNSPSRLSPVDDEQEIAPAREAENLHLQDSLLEESANADPLHQLGRRNPQTAPLRGYSWLPSRCHSLPRQNIRKQETEEGEDDGPEADAEIRGYPSVPEPEGSYRSYASQSSGRGSLDHASSRPSPSLSSPLLTSSPETTEESDRDETTPREPAPQERPRSASVDESYEWDSHYVPADPKTGTAGPEREIPSKGMERRGRRCAVDSGRTTVNRDEKKAGQFFEVLPLSETPLSQEITSRTTCYPDPEPDAVLF